MIINYKKFLFIAVLMLFQTVSNNAVFAQTSPESKGVEAAARVFYEQYLPRFGYPSAADLRRLRPLLSGHLYSSIRYESERMKIWSVKNQGEKPPVAEDLFVCNHYDAPTRFRTGVTSVTRQRVLVTINFDYADRGKIQKACQAKSVFVRSNGRWLLDNIIFEEGPDLRTLLSRKVYEVLPEQ